MRFRRAAALARVPAGAAVLDVGARDGGLRHVLPKAVRYQGIEIDPAFAEPTILVHDISDGLPFPADSYDFAFCLEILEHLPNPGYTLSLINTHLEPGGRLFDHIPNAAGLGNGRPAAATKNCRSMAPLLRLLGHK